MTTTTLTRGWMAMLKRPMLYKQIGFLFFLLVSWQTVSQIFKLDFWISSPVGVTIAMAKWTSGGVLVSDVKVTLMEAGLGFLIGSLAGGLIGFVLGWVRSLGELLEPFVLSLYSLPKVALAPLFVLWFGIGPINKIMFAALMVFFMVFFTTFQGARQVDQALVGNARLLGASNLQIWLRIALPYSSVWFISGLRIGMPYALIGAIVGEFVAANEGVGYRIKEATSFFDTGTVFAGLLILMSISFVLLAVLKWVERRTLKWQTADELTQIDKHPS